MSMRYVQQLSILSFIVLLVSCKNIEDVHKNEYSISTSVGVTGSNFSECKLGETGMSSNLYASNNRVISGSYEHHITNWMYAGLSVFHYLRSYEVCEGDIYGGNMNVHRRLGTNRAYDFSLLPTMKFNWMRKKHFTMYSRLSAGFTYRHEALTLKEDVDYLKDKTLGKTSFRCQVSPLGLEVGSQHIRMFSEIGFGVIGLQYGIRIRY